MKQPAADELNVGAAVARQKIFDVHDVVEGLAHAVVFELLQQRARKAHVHPRHFFVAFQHPCRAIVTPQDLPSLPALVGVVQREQVAERLVHVQPEGVIDLSHP